MLDKEELELYRSIGSSEEFAELAKAKTEGRLVVLPCKVGDTVYAVSGIDIILCKVIEITVKESGISYVQLYSTDDRIANYRYENFCKTVFLTHEAALKQIGGDHEKTNKD